MYLLMSTVATPAFGTWMVAPALSWGPVLVPGTWTTATAVPLPGLVTW